MLTPVTLRSSERGEGTDILVVDDDDNVRDALQEILAAEGYRAAGATNGAEALAFLGKMSAPPSLILLDLMMPEMSGWDFLMRIDADPRLHRIPVALMSAHPSVGRAFDMHRGEERPRRLLFPKPLNLLRLLAAARHFCSEDPTAHHFCSEEPRLAPLLERIERTEAEGDVWTAKEAPTAKVGRVSGR